MNEQELGEFLHKMHLFSTGENHNCPYCGQEVTGATLYEKIEPETYSLYIQPCNHRLGLWSKAPDWIQDVKIVKSEWDDNE